MKKEEKVILWKYNVMLIQVYSYSNDYGVCSLYIF